MVIETCGVSKRYGHVRAVDGVSLRVGAGQIYALLGLNGAGKTTTIRMLLGMVRPSGGRVSLFGAPVRVTDPVLWSRVGYLVEGPAAYPELSVRENLDIVRRLRGLPTASPVEETIEWLGLGPYANRRARTLSTGNAQRLGLAKALLHRPELLILDEPANGLDPAGVVEIRQLLLAATREHGTTVLLSSHVLAEVARLATRIGVIHDGRLVEEFDETDLPHRVRRWLVLATTDSTQARTVLARAGYTTEPGLCGAPGELHACHDSQNAMIIRDPSAVDHPDDLARLLVTSGCPPTRLAVEQEDLETYFLRTVTEHDQDRSAASTRTRTPDHPDGHEQPVGRRPGADPRRRNTDDH